MAEKKKVYVTLVKNGNVTTNVFESQEDAELAGMMDPKGFGLIDSEEPLPSGGAGLTCPHDQYSQREFERTGRLGCPHCYDSLRTLIEPLLERMHKETVHRGKRPQNLRHRFGRDQRVLELQRKLTEAIEQERYEEAARIRDELHAIEDLGE